MVGTFLAAFAGTSVAGAAVAFLARIWIETRLKESIKHEYDKKLEEVKFDIKKREQAALVAELFSKWIHVDEVAMPNARELNKLSFEMSLWLPDELAVVAIQNYDLKT